MQPSQWFREANQSWRISSFNVRRLALDPGAPLGAAGAAVLQEVRLDGALAGWVAKISPGGLKHQLGGHA